MAVRERVDQGNLTWKKVTAAVTIAFAGFSGVLAPTDARAGGLTDFIGDIITAPAKIGERTKNMGEEAELYGKGVLKKAEKEISEDQRRIDENDARGREAQARASVSESRAAVAAAGAQKEVLNQAVIAESTARSAERELGKSAEEMVDRAGARYTQAMNQFGIRTPGGGSRGR